MTTSASSEAVVLYQFEISPFCDKVRRALNYKQISYRCVEIPLARGRSIRRFNRMGKVPVIEHQGQYIADSSAILDYLEQHFPQSPLLPASVSERAQAHILEDWADESLYFYEMALRFTTPGNQQRNLPRLLAHDSPLFRRLMQGLVAAGLRLILFMQGTGRKSPERLLRELEGHCDALNALLSEEQWLTGTSFSRADISVYVMLHCIMDAQEAAAILQRYPTIIDWMQRTETLTRPPL